MPLQFRRGYEAEFTAGSLLTGEPAYCTDTNRLFIGDAAAGAIRIADKDYVDTKIASVADGGPRGVYATLADLFSAYPNGTTGIFVVLSDHKWYYWDDVKWSAGGTYISNVNDYSRMVPTVQTIWDGTDQVFIAIGSPEPELKAGVMARVVYPDDITWDASGSGVGLAIGGTTVVPLVANVGNAYYGKTLSAGTYLTWYDGTRWVILGVAQKLGCDYNKPLLVNGSRVLTDNDLNSDTTLNVKRVIAHWIYEGEDAEDNRVALKSDIADVKTIIDEDNNKKYAYQLKIIGGKPTLIYDEVIE